jgi:molybdenum cofactor cytidylyltransferase
MGASISSALRAILARARPRAVVVMLADMPAIRVDTLKALLRAWLARSEAACAVLRYRGRRGHPVVFGSSAFDGLLALSGDRGAARLIDSLTPIFLDVDDPGILNDIDTPADLMQLEEHPHGTKSDE